MGTKTLSISEEAYEKLNRLKRHGESFSQLIIRLTERKGDPELILETLEEIIHKDSEGSRELADNIEAVYTHRKNRKTMEIDL